MVYKFSIFQQIDLIFFFFKYGTPKVEKEIK